MYSQFMMHGQKNIKLLVRCVTRCSDIYCNSYNFTTINILLR